MTVNYGNNDGYPTSLPPWRTNLGPLNPSDTEYTTIIAIRLEA